MKLRADTGTASACHTAPCPKPDRSRGSSQRLSVSSRVAVSVARAGARVVIEVRDDGVGGANIDAGSGLRGLADRVDALGGHHRISSRAGGGTRIRADIPCA